MTPQDQSQQHKAAPASGPEPPKSELQQVVEKPLMGLLKKYKGQISAILPKQFNEERVLKLIVGAINKNPDLLKCTPLSVINAVLTAASIGLEIRPGSAYLLPFFTSFKDGNGQWRKRSECQLVIDYRGKIDLALRSGKVMDVDPDIVYSKDKFRIYRDENGMKCVEHEPLYFKIGEDGSHLPITEADRGVPIGALAVAAIKDGRPKVCFMPKIDIDRIKSLAPGKDNEKSPWKVHEMEMWKKTVVHRICKTLPQTPESALADQADSAAESGVTFDVIDVDALDAADDTPLLPESKEAAEAVAQRKIAELDAARKKPASESEASDAKSATFDDTPTYATWDEFQQKQKADQSAPKAVRIKEGQDKGYWVDNGDGTGYASAPDPIAPVEQPKTEPKAEKIERSRRAPEFGRGK